MQYGILGPLQAIGDDGVELVLGGAMPRAVLALLLLRANEVVASDRLIEELWAGKPPPSGAKALQVHVSRLRRALAAGGPGERLVTTAGGYLLHVGHDELDTQRCQRLIDEGREQLAQGHLERAHALLTAALAVWRGGALCDFEYEPFAQAEIARFGELRATALEERIEVELRLGRAAQMVGELESLVSDYPYRERMRGQLMLALYRAGRQAEALAAYRTARTALVDELGIEPSADLRRLHEAMLAQEDALLIKPAAAPTHRAPARAQRRLPAPATPLIGRELELAELGELARSHRLITLTGPGGTGKTRLALELSAQLVEHCEDGACWVPLQSVTDPALVPAAIGDALGEVEDLPTYLSGRAMLLVLDNFEQVIDAAAAIGELLSDAPRCAAIVTSRERLGLSAEQEYPVPPLSSQDAIELFTARARQVDPGFEPGQQIGAICEQLDRLPLALELAAPRVKLLPERQLLARLEQRLPLLAGARRDLPDRQSTMRAAIAWSYDLLGEPEQRLFSRLAVFIGSFPLEDAEQVCDAELDTVQSLSDKSLVRNTEDGRFFLLETTREYALEQLAMRGEQDGIRARHARRYFALGVAAAGEDLERAEALTRLRQDPANAGLALAWALDNDIAAALPLANALFFPWLASGRVGELRNWYESALAQPEALSPRDRADALAGLGFTLAYLEHLDRAREVLTEALALYRDAGDERNEARVLLSLGGIEFLAGAPDGMITCSEQALAIAERLQDPEGIARAMHYLAEGLRDVGEFARAADLYTRSIELKRAHGLGPGTGAVHSLGDLWLDNGDPIAAECYYREALTLAIAEEDVRTPAYCLAGLACIATRNEDPLSAGRLWTLAERIEQQVGFRMLAVERRRYEAILDGALRASEEYEAGTMQARAEPDPLRAAAAIVGSDAACSRSTVPE